jgi:hypothetical protein
MVFLIHAALKLHLLAYRTGRRLVRFIRSRRQEKPT